MALASQAQIAPQQIDILINRRSGTVLALGEDAVQKGLQEALGPRLGTLSFIEGADIAPRVEAWVAAAPAGRGLILGGGDGSVLTAAGAFLGRDDITLGVLPLGTHNLFARQLGFAADFRQAAAQYKNIEAGQVDVGQVNGRNFLVGLMLDQNSVNFLAAREQLRDGRKVTGLSKIFGAVSRVLFGPKEALDVSGEEQSARIFMISNNRMTPRSNAALSLAPKNIKPAIENIFAKSRADDGQLSFYGFEGGIANLPGLLKDIRGGDWSLAKSVTVREAPEFIVGPVTKKAGKHVNIVLDGEVTKASFPLEVKLLPKALQVYRPRS